MCLILRVEGGFLSARRQEPGPDAPRLSGFNRYRLEALVTRETWKVLSHNVAVHAQHFPAIF